MRFTLASKVLKVWSQSSQILVTRSFLPSCRSRFLITVGSSSRLPSASKVLSRMHFEQKTRPHFRQWFFQTKIEKSRESFQQCRTFSTGIHLLGGSSQSNAASELFSDSCAISFLYLDFERLDTSPEALYCLGGVFYLVGSINCGGGC